MPQSCKDLRAALAFCLQNSDCIMVERHQPGECLRPPLKYTLPKQCQQLQKGYAECKKGQIDMRKRFRGNRPISVSKVAENVNPDGRKAEEDSKEGTIEEKGYMLYAGRRKKDKPVIPEGDGEEK
ncbi:cytochrome c oxidase assembly protein PET191-domain-containing protein [Clohesyomyces aquaticus]|uniref:Cytochrome c oxidase assembly protein PET191-domain-containing protein n=1 Tax=Clohesyomyces aquaticus TaxID=1231657 RepID=A0A1Y2A4C9_9PLEO|nr:cytochrome c oxidase assembly protein PET191-domain-containing protein [Clohesyomyces aquaticus]